MRPLHTNAGFTLLECMIALLLMGTCLIIVVESQSFAIDQQEKANRISTATMLAHDVMTRLELQMSREGWGELEVHEHGDFHEDHYNSMFDDYRWEYEVEKVELELPGLGNLMGLMGQGQEEVADAAGISGNAQPQANELGMLASLGIDMSFFSEMMGNFLREARVRVCYPDGYTADGEVAENCIEFITHLTNPTGAVNPADDDGRPDDGLDN